jgi:S-methylmethionine-dependent homocysteine/selenocysteine methylase
MMAGMTSRVTVLDGGMGRELMRIGAPFRQPEWSALALTESPQHVVQAHRNFIDAGAQVITTNSYALVPFHIGEERFAAEAFGLAELSGRLAREAADGAPHPVLVAGSLPPLFGSYEPDLFDASNAERIIDPLIAGLAEHVDIWLGETLSSIVEATTVCQALDRAGSFRQPLWISFTLNEHGALRSGERVADAVATAIDIGATTILFNCCAAESITTAIDIAVATARGSAAVGGYANRFVTTHADGSAANTGIAAFRDDLDPESYAEFVTRWLDAGATVVGGCCGMEPAHIAQISAIVAAK